MSVYVSLDGKGFSVYYHSAGAPVRVAGPFATSTAAWRAAKSFARARWWHPVRRRMSHELAQYLYQNGHRFAPIRGDVMEELC